MFQNEMLKYKRIIKIVAIVSLILMTIMATSYWIQKYTQKSKASFEGIRLTCTPRDSQGSVGEELQLSIAMDTDNKKVSAVDLVIDYDSSHIEILSFKRGAIFSNMLTSDSQFNQARYVMGVAPGNPFSGTGIVGQLKVKLLSERQSQIKFNEKTKVAELESNKNELSSTDPCVINK